jgi:hypothetical protein
MDLEFFTVGHGMIRNGVLRHIVVWSSSQQDSISCYGTAWLGVLHSQAWHSIAWHGTARHGTAYMVAFRGGAMREHYYGV